MDEYSDIELLAELIRRNQDNTHDAPSKREYFTPHYDVLIGVGKDHTADITLDHDAMSELMELTK